MILGLMSRLIEPEKTAKEDLFEEFVMERFSECLRETAKVRTYTRDTLAKERTSELPRTSEPRRETAKERASEQKLPQGKMKKQPQAPRGLHQLRNAERVLIGDREGVH